MVAVCKVCCRPGWYLMMSSKVHHQQVCVGTNFFNDELRQPSAQQQPGLVELKANFVEPRSSYIASSSTTHILKLYMNSFSTVRISFPSPWQYCCCCCCTMEPKQQCKVELKTYIIHIPYMYVCQSAQLYSR
jgi:hypothetical protein